MGSIQWLSLLFLLFSTPPSHAKTLKLLTPSTESPFTTTISSSSTTVPLDTTEYTTESAIEHLVAFTDSSHSSREQVLEILQNETISLDEFDFSDNSTTTLPVTTTTVQPPKGMIRQCRCTEVIECRKESRNETENCFDYCDEQLGFLGNSSHSYMDCFEKNKDGIVHAEDCVESAMGTECNPSLTPQFLEARDHEEYKNTKFIQSKEPKKSRVFHRTHHSVAGFHEFFHCTKTCIHKRMIKCLRKNNCSIRLPSIPSFGETMSSCAKNNIKVSRSIRSTCQCLLHKKKLKQLAGTCASITPSRG